MSTTFGIPQRKISIDSLCDDEGNLLDYIDPSFFEKIFYRGNAGYDTRWLNNIAHLLPDYTRVYPLDNTAQGILTICDIKEHLQTKYEQ